MCFICWGGADPVWAAEAVSHPFMGWVMCCTEETSGRCLAGADCGGQVTAPAKEALSLLPLIL